MFWHKYDIEKATADLQNFTPFPDEWTVEDKVLFEQGYQFHGKSFNRIRQMVSKLFNVFKHRLFKLTIGKIKSFKIVFM